MTAKDLKNALLQEAVQGKLVPQIASEGNARDLLEEIRKEKLSHGLDFANAKSGKKKSQKETALAGSNPCDITEEEIPFEIPENWCWCRLGELVYNHGQKTPEQEFSYIDIGSIDNEHQRLNKKENIITPDKAPSRARKIVFEGDVIYSTVRPYLHNICIIDKKFSKEPIASTGFAVMASTEVLFNKYLFYYLLSPIFDNYANATDNAKGVAYPAINDDKLYKGVVPLPPLAEQKRIVAGIEKFMPLIEEYGKKESALKAINKQIGTLTKKAILQEAVQGKLVPQIAAEGNARDLLEEINKEKTKLIKEGKIKKEKPLPEISEDEIPFDIPENWCWCRLSELCNLYTGDSINETEKKLKYTNVKEGWFYIGTKDVNFDQTINYDNGIKIPFEKDNFRIAPKNTVLMCIEGGSAGRKIAFTNQDVCFGNKLCCFNSYKNEIEKFIFYFLQSTLFTDAFKDNINGIIGGVSINNLKGMLFPLPPLSEQKRIVAAIEQMLPLCEKLGT